MRPSQPGRFQKVFRTVKGWFQRKPKSPGDPYAYVAAPKKPRLPHLSASAVAEWPDE